MGRIKAAFFDIDGTMVSFKTHLMPDEVYDALLRLKSEGVRIVVASGRPVDYIDNVRDVPFDAWVGCNGAQVLDPSGKILFSSPIDRDEAIEIARIGTENNIPTYTFSNKLSCLNCTNERSRHIADKIHLRIPPIMDIVRFCEENPIYEFTTYVTLEEEAELFRPVLHKVEYLRWHPTFTDLNPAGCDKGVALKALCNLWGIDPSETAAFGDGGNDIPMIRAAGIGVAMGGCSPAVAGVASLLTSSVDEGGIVKALRQIL